MSITLEFKGLRETCEYQPNETVSGYILVNCPSTISHNGIELKYHGEVKLELSARTVGLFEAFYSKIKPTVLMDGKLQVCGPGTLRKGEHKLPFKFTAKALEKNEPLPDTYHGVYIGVLYHMIATIKRGLLLVSPAIKQEFYILSPTKPEAESKQIPFSVSPANIKNISRQQRAKIAHFLFEGRIDSAVCDLNKPFTGEIIIRESQNDIKSIELQLVRVEICPYSEGEAREATEVQNIQIGSGNVIPNLPIPIYMLFPRIFTCSTLRTNSYRVEFEINIIVVFSDDHMVTENFPIRLYRVSTPTTRL